MAELPDQFLFINKTAKSGSLSHSRAKEKANIYSHVHGKYHKDRKASKQQALHGATTAKVASNHLITLNPSAESIAADGLQQTSPSSLKNSQPEKRSNSMKYPIQRLHTTLDGSAMDPFYCSSIVLNAEDQSLLFYPFKGSVETTFSAESLADLTKSHGFRHRKAVTMRLQRCVVDDLTMYTTLAYCASRIKWTSGEGTCDRPAETYTLKAIEALRSRLAKGTAVDCWLLLSIVALAANEMWAQQYDAATAHLKMICHFVAQIGGVTRLESYLRENILLCDKYVAIAKFEPPILPLDWEPAPLPRKEMIEIRSQVHPVLGNLGQGFLDMAGNALGDQLLLVIRDVVVCIQVAEFRKLELTVDASHQQWLFLRHQALFSRLLLLKLSSFTQECTRIALIIWLLKITASFGSQHHSTMLPTKLKAAIIQLDTSNERCVSPLMFWMSCLGAMTAESEERKWFLIRTVKIARSLGIKADKELYKQLLHQYFFLESEDGSQFIRLVQTARDMEEGADLSC